MTERTKFALAQVAAVLVFAIGVLLSSDVAVSTLYLALMLLALLWEAPVRTILLALSASLAIGVTAWLDYPSPTILRPGLAVALIEVWMAAAAIAWRQLADGRIRRQARLAGSLLDNAPAPMFIRDREGRHLLVNAAFREMRGLSEGAAEGRTPREFVSAERAAVMLEADRRVLETAQPLRRETVEIRPNGDRIDRLVVRFPIRDQAGVVIAIGGVATDISEQRRAERSLRESEAMFRAFLGHMPGMLNLKDADGRFIMVNRAMEDRFGRPSAAFVGKTLEQMMPLRPGNGVIQAEEQRILATGEPSTFE